MIFPVIFAGYLAALALIIAGGMIVAFIACVISFVRFAADRSAPRSDKGGT